MEGGGVRVLVMFWGDFALSGHAVPFSLTYTSHGFVSRPIWLVFRSAGRHVAAFVRDQSPFSDTADDVRILSTLHTYSKWKF